MTKITSHCKEMWLNPVEEKRPEQEHKGTLLPAVVITPVLCPLASELLRVPSSGMMVDTLSNKLV